MSYIGIKKKAALLSYLDSLEERRCQVIALDMEAELHQHAYGEKLCLVQVFDGTQTVIIDPFNIDSQALKAFFENRGILKIVYDASSDSSLLKNAYDIQIKSLLDLRPAVDLLGHAKKDLHSVIAAELGVVLVQKEKYQRYNWTKRPIDKRALDYAISDVTYLFRLKDALLKKLYEAGLLDIYILKNLQVQDRDYTRNPEDRYRKVKGFHALSGAEKQTFEKLFNIREKYAKRLNMPSHNVISRTDLLNLARDAGYINNIRFPRRFRDSLIRSILEELRGVGRET
jgi:ribonuclease D